MKPVSSKAFTDYLIRRAEHFDAEIIKDLTPYQGWVGHVTTGMFPTGRPQRFRAIKPIYHELSSLYGPNALPTHYQTRLAAEEVDTPEEALPSDLQDAAVRRCPKRTSYPSPQDCYGITLLDTEAGMPRNALKDWIAREMEEGMPEGECPAPARSDYFRCP